MFSRIYSALSSRVPAALSLSWFSTSSPKLSMSPSVAQLVDSAIAENKVVIFSKSYCPFCRSAKNLFKENFPQIKAKVLELDELENGSEIQAYLLEKTKQRTVPNIFVDSVHIGGNDDTRAALTSGKLAGLLAQ